MAASSAKRQTETGGLDVDIVDRRRQNGPLRGPRGDLTVTGRGAIDFDVEISTSKSIAPLPGSSRALSVKPMLSYGGACYILLGYGTPGSMFSVQVSGDEDVILVSEEVVKVMDKDEFSR
ncbi:hypothetical protein TNIN_227501 [Trichonephila inaurata madagascariensis]|uniref:Uncharacterized protein n=1 Tax=Trichonephila inaurata madagascariensis TaxID=2747483 RepID=A0A8X6MD61_9ARAC|nr:hypothetical protein TNIN_4331 [Trichonephila inaurata madagascariensis]GFY69446.1 hypothetical protein TNIN_227501 [Trichonephila inaurata madagascariensis]